MEASGNGSHPNTSVHPWYLSLDPITYVTSLIPCACYPSVVVGWRREGYWDLVASTLAKTVRSRFRERPCLKGIW